MDDDDIVMISSDSENEEEKCLVKNPFQKSKMELKSESSQKNSKPETNGQSSKRTSRAENMDSEPKACSSKTVETLNESTCEERPSKKVKLQEVKINEEKSQPQNGDTSADSNDIYTNSTPSTSIACPPTPVKKPTLVIRDKKPVEAIDKTTYEKFLKSCRRIESGNEMEIILKKLNKTHKKLDPSDASSLEVIEYLQKKIVQLETEKKVYIRIREVKDFLKQIIKRNEPKENDREGEKELTKEERKKMKYIRYIEATLEKIEKKIKELESREVDWDDEDDSAYIQESKYKERAVTLHKELCKLTGSSTNADRKYLKPHSLNLSGIPELDDAISSFVYSKPKKGQGSRKALEAIKFPEYLDILKCVKKCNKEKNLGMDSRQEQTKAKETFKKVGEYLRNLRQMDFFETVKYFAENDVQDPAEEDNDLKTKLNENNKLGRSKMNELCEKYVSAQENGISTLYEKHSSDESEEDEAESEKSDNNDSDIEEENDDDEAEVEGVEEQNMSGEKDKVEESKTEEPVEEQKQEETGNKEKPENVCINPNGEILISNRPFASPPVEGPKDNVERIEKPTIENKLSEKSKFVTLTLTKDSAILERPKISSVTTLANSVTYRTKVPMSIVQQLPKFAKNLIQVSNEMPKNLTSKTVKVPVKPNMLQKRPSPTKPEEKSKSPEKPKNIVKVVKVVKMVETEKKTETVRVQNTKKTADEIEIIEEKMKIETANSLNEADSDPKKEKNSEGNPEVAILSPQCVIDLEEPPSTSQKPTLRVANFAKVPESWDKSNLQKSPLRGEPEVSIIETSHSASVQSPRSQHRDRVHKSHRNFKVKTSKHYKLVSANSMAMHNPNLTISRNPGTSTRREQPSNAPLIVTKSTTIQYDPRSLELSTVTPQNELLSERVSSSIVRILSPSKVIIKSFPRH